MKRTTINTKGFKLARFISSLPHDSGILIFEFDNGITFVIGETNLRQKGAKCLRRTKFRRVLTKSTSFELTQFEISPQWIIPFTMTFEYYFNAPILKLGKWLRQWKSLQEPVPIEYRDYFNQEQKEILVMLQFAWEQNYAAKS